LIRAILFDFGNVLAFFDHRQAVRHFATQCDMAEVEMLQAIYDGPLEHEFESGRLTGDEFISRVIDRIGYRGTADEFRGEFVDIFTPNPPILELLPRLARSFRLVLASNTNELHSAHFRREYADSLRHFHALGMSWRFGVRKPTPEFFGHCLRLAECDPAEAFFVDDMPANVAGAESVGIPGICYHPGMDLLAELRCRGAEIE
jgi:glucose-1-phosphatase